MANPQRGEIEAILNGKSYTLCLTLGALAELEATFESRSLLELIERFETGQIKSADLIKLLAAGLKGGGYDIPEREVAAMPIEGGIAAIIRTVTRLLNATFSFEQNPEN